MITTLGALGALLISANGLFEETRPFVSTLFGAPGFIYSHERCSRYNAEPVIDVIDGTTTITHAEGALSCSGGPNRSHRNVALGRYPVGRHRATYVQRRGDGTTSSRSVDFIVPEESRLFFAFNPPDPLALEPVDVQFTVNSCETDVRVLPVDGGFRVALTGPEPPAVCDASGFLRTTIGAFAPGTYRIAVGRLASDGMWTEFEAHTLIVSPGPSALASELPHPPERDLSGLWWSPREAPSSGLYVVHARVRAETPSNELTVFWYTYDGAGRAAWYVLTPEPPPAVDRFAVRQFAAPPGASSVIGSAEIIFNFGDDKGFFSATVGTTAHAFPIERFRWVHAGWRE